MLRAVLAGSAALCADLGFAQGVLAPLESQLSTTRHGEAAIASLGTCPGPGDCCAANGGLGCNDFECCDWVCFIDDFCCTVEWNEDCAGYAELFCPELCEPQIDCGAGDCCSDNSTGCEDAACCEIVCIEDASCCLTGWTENCSQIARASCDICPTIHECPQTGPCCEVHFGGGCDRPGCCQTVCEIDPTCCSGTWGLTCARTARETCLTVCQCESYADFDADQDVDLLDLANFQTCFSGAAPPPLLAGCACADYDGDGDADWVDFTHLEAILTGP